MAGIYETLKQGNDEKFAQQTALVQSPMQALGVAARGAVNDIGAIVATPMIGVSNAVGDAWQGAKNFRAGFSGLPSPAAPVVKPTPATPPVTAAPTVAAAPTGLHTPESLKALEQSGLARPQTLGVDGAYKPATATGARGVYNEQTVPGAVASPTAALAQPTAAMKPPVMNPALLDTQAQLLNTINQAQAVVAAGSNRDGYKMGDVTKGLLTMQNMSPMLNSVNNLIGQTYGTDAGMVNHTLDSTTRSNIAAASNATELAKTKMAGEFGLQKGIADNEAAAALATHKTALEYDTPAGKKAIADAARTALEVQAIQQGGFGAIGKPQYHYVTSPDGKDTKVWMNGVLTDPRVDKLLPKK